MIIRDTVSTALKGVTTNRMRSMLTMLGIIIGVGSVVLMSSIGASMQRVILSQISSLGAKSMVIFPGQEEGGPGVVAAGHDSLTFDDLTALENLSTVQYFAPVIFVPGKITYERDDASSQVLGVTERFFANQHTEATEGRLIDDTDVDGAKFIAVLGPDAADKLFGIQDPMGKRIQIGENHFTVIGITEALGSQFFQNADDRIYVPFSVARNVTGQKYLSYVTMEAVEDFDLALADVKSLLRVRHGISNPEDDPQKDDFIVHTSAEASQILGAVSLGLSMFITTIAGISLLVGGIGIMNIMLVSVTERTREIGLRKAVGAKRRDILLQFLLESIVLTLIGGVIGMTIGLGLAFFVALIVPQFLSTYVFAVSVPATFSALAMAALTGLVFGISPARKAAALHPIEALRYE
jgi:putative ABC transport system permease protein